MKVLSVGLPWRLASFGGLLVLIVGIVIQVDPWISLQRTGAAFALFWVLGSMGRILLTSSSEQQAESGQERSEQRPT